VTRRRRRSKSYAHERWLTTYYFFKNQARGCTPAGAKPVTAGEAFRLRLHAMRIRDHALPPTQNYDTSFFFLHRVLSVLVTFSPTLHYRSWSIPTAPTPL
jgi:hypothetical protein